LFSSGQKGQQGIKGINNGQSFLSIVRRDEQDREARRVGGRTCFWRSLDFSLKAVGRVTSLISMTATRC
jgi:hypothetical protein